MPELHLIFKFMSNNMQTQDSKSVVTLPPGVRSIVMNMCERVCLCVSVREDISGTTREFFIKFLCMLPMAVARSSSGVVAISYVLSVLSMISCFLPIMGYI